MWISNLASHLTFINIYIFCFNFDIFFRGKNQYFNNNRTTYYNIKIQKIHLTDTLYPHTCIVQLYSSFLKIKK